MHRRQWIARLAAVTAMGVAGIVVKAAAAPAVQGDTAAYEEIGAAYKKLHTLSGYRMKGTLPDGSTLQGEFAPPNSHFTVHTNQGGVIESYVVGNTSAVKMSGGGLPSGGQCRRTSGQRPSQFARDPTEFSGNVTVTRKPDTEIDGTPVHDYAYAQVAPEGSRNGGDIYIETQSGLPRRVLIAGGDKAGTLDYYDYGATISITLPC